MNEALFAQMDSLTFDDVLVEPGFSQVLPAQVDVHANLTREIKLNIPLLSAAMDTVTESRLAIALAREGGVGIIHRNLSPEDQAREVETILDDYVQEALASNLALRSQGFDVG